MHRTIRRLHSPARLLAAACLLALGPASAAGQAATLPAPAAPGHPAIRVTGGEHPGLLLRGPAGGPFLLLAGSSAASADTLLATGRFSAGGHALLRVSAAAIETLDAGVHLTLVGADPATGSPLRLGELGTTSGGPGGLSQHGGTSSTVAQGTTTGFLGGVGHNGIATITAGPPSHLVMTLSATGGAQAFVEYYDSNDDPVPTDETQEAISDIGGYASNKYEIPDEAATFTLTVICPPPEVCVHEVPGVVAPGESVSFQCP